MAESEMLKMIVCFMLYKYLPNTATKGGNTVTEVWL